MHPFTPRLTSGQRVMPTHLPVVFLLQLDADLVDERDPAGAGVGLMRRFP